MTRASSIVKSELFRVLVLCFLVSTLCAGCSSKQAGLDASGSLSLNVKGAPLSDSEKASLAKNRGKIARQVPAYAEPVVEQQSKYFLRGGRKTMEVTSKRAENYLAYARGVFRSHGLPEELAYLAMVESGYNTRARSRAGAAGAWQFMPYTGMKFGLAQDKWQDERLDIYHATDSAARYLKKLHDDFGDWPTAIAAYNAGEGKMSRACEAAGERTFFGVMRKNDRLDEKTRLKAETLQYVPRFLAVTAIMENLPELGFEEIHPERAARMTKVRIRPRTNLKAMASACGMSWGEFQTYNPHFKRSVSHASQHTNAYVPESRGAMAMAYARNPVSVSTVMLASAETTGTGKAARASGSAKKAAYGRGGTYTLRPGDTLTRVARKYNTSVQALLAANNLRDANSIHAGQTLAIPGRATTVAQAGSTRTGKGGVNTYRVQPRDNLWQISRKLNVSVDDLKRWNNLRGQDIHVGQRLVVMR